MSDEPIEEEPQVPEPEPEQAPQQEQPPPEPPVAPADQTYEERLWGGRIRFFQCLRCAFDTQNENEMIHHAEVGCPQHWQEMREAAERRST